MKNRIVTLRKDVKESKTEEIRIAEGDEGFVLTLDGELLTLPSGCNRLPAGSRAFALRRMAACEGVAGAGEAPGPRGWFCFRCELLCPRRFALRYQSDLLDGDAGAVLTCLAREALNEALNKARADGGTARSVKLWAECRRILEQRLLDCGWQLTRFRPCRLTREGEVSA